MMSVTTYTLTTPSLSVHFLWPLHVYSRKMRVEIAVTGLLFAFSAHAVLVPHNVPDALSQSLNITELAPDPAVQIGCTGTQEFNHTEWDGVVTSMQTSCNIENLRPSQSIIWSYGKVKLYVCNHNSGGNSTCSTREFADYSRLIDAKCGSYKPGWAYIPDLAKTYGKDVIGSKSCYPFP